MIHNFTRGGQTTMHSIRMFGQVSIRVIRITLFLYLILAGYFSYQTTSSYQRYLVGNYLFAKLELAFQGNQAVHEVLGINGQPFKMNIIQYINHPSLQNHLQTCFSACMAALFKSGWISALFVLSCIVFLCERGRLKKIKKYMRGALFLEPKYLKKFLKKNDNCSDIKIAGVPLVKDSETKHILITGTTGAGKSVCMMELMDNIRKREQRAIVYDASGSFIQHYYRPNRDIILNPLDDRCPVWNIWQDAHDLADFEAIAASLMPLHLSGNDPFWINSARTIFSTLAEKLKDTPEAKTKPLLRYMFSANLKSLSDMLQDTVAETSVSQSVEKLALSIKSTLSTYCKSLLYLKEEGTDMLFSIKRWLKNENHDGWIFIASNAEKLEAIKPLISIWMDVAARGVLSLPPSFERRIWFLIDELASLHRLPSLDLLLSQGRKYGVCAVTAFQDIHQMRSIYGRNDSEALMAMHNTNICFRTKCPDTASWMSRLTGQREVVEQREGFSYGANDIRDGVSIHQEHRKEPLILDTEFLKLNDCEAYMVLPGNTPITKIKLKIKKRNVMSDMLRPRVLDPFTLTTKNESAVVPVISQVDARNTEVTNRSEPNQSGHPIKEDKSQKNKQTKGKKMEVELDL